MVKDRPDCHVEEDLVAAEDEHHLDEHDGRRPATNCASSLADLERFEEARALLRKTLPVAQRVLGENDMTTLNLRGIYGAMLHKDPASTLDDLRESVRTLEDLARTARRVLGGAHPLAQNYEYDLRKARAVLRARETPSPGSS